MKVSTRRIDRLTIDLEPGDSRYYVPNPFSQSFYIEPTQVIAEYDRDEADPLKRILRAEVTGQRYRHMASGEIKKVGPGRGGWVEKPTTWELPSRASMPDGLLRLLHDAYLLR